MKQSIFSLADVLTVLTALIFGFICFLGKNFSTSGDTYVSIMWGVFITISLSGTAFLAKFLKQTSVNFKINLRLEIVVLFLFTCLMGFFAFTTFPIYFTVSENKTEIQTILKASITQAENMFSDYERFVLTREASFKGALDAAIATQNPSDLNKYDLISPERVPYNTQISHKMSMLHSDLIPPNYSDTNNDNGLKEVATVWLTKAKNYTDYWKPIGVIFVVNDLEKNTEDWLNKIIGFSKQVNVKGVQYYPFTHKLTFNEVKSRFTKTGKPTLISVALSVGAYLLMLLSWFVTKRHTRSIGILTTATYEVLL